MRVTLKHPVLVGAMVLFIAFLGFSSGWFARKHMQDSLPAATRKLFLQPPGDGLLARPDRV